MLQGSLLDECFFFVINNSLTLHCYYLISLRLVVMHLVSELAHLWASFRFRLHLIDLCQAHRLLVQLNLFAQLLLTLVFVEFLLDFSLLLTPVFQVFDLFELFLTALGIDLILNCVLGNLFFYPFRLLNLKTFLALFEFDLLLLKLFTKHLLTFFII